MNDPRDDARPVDYSGPCPACALPDAVLPDGQIPTHNVYGLASVCDAPPTLATEPTRRELIARMARDSIDLGLYDTPAADYPPADTTRP